MPLAQILYLTGIIAAFTIFGLVLAFCRLASPSSPLPAKKASAE